jgi:hypothetical protein
MLKCISISELYGLGDLSSFQLFLPISATPNMPLTNDATLAAVRKDLLIPSGDAVMNHYLVPSLTPMQMCCPSMHIPAQLQTLHIM